MLVLFILTGAALLAMVGEFIGLGRFLKFLVGFLLVSALLFSYSHLSVYYQMLSFSCVSSVFSSIILFFALFSFLSIPKSEPMYGSRVALLIFSIVGALLMVSYTHFVFLFLGIELLSIPLYVLVTGSRQLLVSKEAALKYFLIGSFVSAILLFGIALVFYQTGSFYLTEVGSHLATQAPSPILIVGLLMIAASMCFKCGLFPFHFWTPDVYEGSSSSYTMYMATVVKMASFLAFFPLIFFCFGVTQSLWVTLFIGIALFSMTVGNLLAVRQQSLKRVLAYSSIAHAGFMFLPLAIFDVQFPMIINYYNIAYGLSSVGLFLVIQHLERKEHIPTFSSLKGMFLQSKWLLALGVVSLLSLAGIPLTAGFFAKFQVLSVAYVQGHIGIVVIALINTLLAAFYYFKCLIYMFTPSESEVEIVPVSIGYKFLAVFLIVAIFVVGIYPIFYL